MMNSDTVIVKAQRLQRPDEMINIDLPAFFMYKLNASDKKWVMVKGPTSKFYVENIYEHIEKKLEKGHTAEEHHFMVRLPRTNLRGPWRTDTTLPAGQQGLDQRVL